MTLKNGNKLQYDALITTMPLDITLQWCGQKKWADGLTRRCGPSRVDLCIGLLAVPGTVAVSAIVHPCSPCTPAGTKSGTLGRRFAS